MFKALTPEAPVQNSEHLELLHGIDIFAKLNDEELDAVSRCIEERESEPGEVMIAEGVPGEALYVILSGKVAVEKNNSDGSTIQLAELAKGAVFGEMSLIDDVPTSATVKTLEPSRLIVISRMDLNVLLNWDTVLAAKMWRSFTEMLCYRLRTANDRLLTRLGDDAKDDILATSGMGSK